MRLTDLLNGMSRAAFAPEGGEGGTGGAAPPAGGEGGAGGVETGAGGAGKTWYEGADAEAVGYLQNRGWDKLTPAQAALEAGKAHRAAERMIGVPADKLIRVADPTNEAEYKAMWQRLGAADAPEKYDLSGIKNAKDQPIAPAMAARLQAAFAANNVPLPQAQAIARELVKLGDDTALEAHAAQEAKLAENRAALAKEWGANATANKFIAQQAAEKLGVTPEAVAALEGLIGYKDTMEMFRKIGEQMGEAKFVNNPGPNGDVRISSVGQAQERKAALYADEAWVKSYLDGDAAKNREMLYLNSVITGEDASTYQAA